jgi:hypothetical protein
MLATPRPGRDGYFYPDGSGPFAVTIRPDDGGFPSVDVARSKAGGSEGMPSTPRARVPKLC